MMEVKLQTQTTIFWVRASEAEIPTINQRLHVIGAQVTEITNALVECLRFQQFVWASGGGDRDECRRVW